MEEVLDHLCAQATGFIRERARQEEPFFLYFPLSAPHKPVLPHPRFRGKSALGPYGDFVVQVDAVVGQVLGALEAAGVREDTLLVYTSDNGSFMFRRDAPDATDHLDDETIQAYRADRHRANGPWRGTKADIWEGGHRVPFFAVWPGRVAPGSRCRRTICLTDLMATCAQLAGVSLPQGCAEDSYGLLPLLEGRAQGWERPPVIHHSAAGMFAIRDGRWKLVAGNGSGGRQQPRGKPFGEPYQLFDLEEDPAEARDRIASEPEVARRLRAALERIRSSGRSVAR
jgi:arylsulfatase A-like enzyme